MLHKRGGISGARSKGGRLMEWDILMAVLFGVASASVSKDWISSITSAIRRRRTAGAGLSGAASTDPSADAPGDGTS